MPVYSFIVVMLIGRGVLSLFYFHCYKNDKLKSELFYPRISLEVKNLFIKGIDQPHLGWRRCFSEAKCSGVFSRVRRFGRLLDLMPPYVHLSKGVYVIMTLVKRPLRKRNRPATSRLEEVLFRGKVFWGI